MRFFVVPGIGQLELNGERSARGASERMVWSPLKLRPAVILGYYGYPISGRGKDVNGARSGLDWQRMMDRCQQIILGLILGTELNDNAAAAAAAASTAAQTTFLSIIGPAWPARARGSFILRIWG